MAPRTSVISHCALWLAGGIAVSSGGCRQTPRRQPVAAAAPLELPSTASPHSVDVLPDDALVSLVKHDEVAEFHDDSEFESATQQAQLLPPEEIAASSPSLRSSTDTSAALAATGQPVEYFVGLALQNHPRVRASRARVAAASNRAPQASSLEDPVVTNSFYPFSDQALQTAAGRAGHTLSVAQKYPWPEKRWTKAAIADRETQIAAAQLEQIQLEIEETVRLAYYELWFANQAIKITEQNRQVAAELVRLAETRYGAGGRQQDVLRAQLQLDSLDDRLIGLRRQKAVAKADLAALIQQPAEVGIEPTADTPVEQVPEQLGALFAAAQQCNPRLRERRWAVSRDRQKQQLACLGQYPDFTLGAGWQTITESAAVSPVANGHDNVNFLVGVTLPIWRDRIDASIREASAEVAASAREFDDARDDAFRQIRRLSDQAAAADQQLRLYSERIVPRAKRSLQLASADYRGKLADFGDVTDGFTEVLMFELQIARTKATLAGTVAQLHRAVGCEVLVDAGR